MPWREAGQSSNELIGDDIMPRVRTIDDVVSWQLCTGCGACAYVEPARYQMIDDPALGRRPITIGNGTSDRGQAMEVCPGHRLEHDFDENDPALLGELRREWGPVRAVWEGHAADPDIRWAGSSGGAATALALYSIERAGLHGVLHIDKDLTRPYLNRTVLSTSRQELMAATGSRYAPASPCDRLDLIEAAPGRCVFIGKPCDVAAVQRARTLRPGLDTNLGPVIAFFCAGTPSTRGTLDLLDRAGVPDPDSVTDVRYRGNGWPGRWVVRFSGPEGEEERSLTYEESWGFLERYRQWRCFICPDHTGEFADVAVGDPWYRQPGPGEHGHSLILARTQTGLRLILDAERAGYLVLERSDPGLVPASQPNLLKTRGRLWGQLLTLRSCGVPTPSYQGMPSFRTWLNELGWSEKLRSTLGTVRRIGRRRLRERIEVTPMDETDE